MHLKNDKKEIKINAKIDKVIGKLFKALPKSYQNNLETAMSRSEFIFDCVSLLYYKCYKKLKS